MISRLRGTVLEHRPLQLVVDVSGIGYLVSVPLGHALPRPGQPVELYTYAVYREDAVTLYGFNNPTERDFFSILVEKISGIGPKTALALMSALPGGRLQTVVEAGDLATLKATPGVGKKTAERLLLELKGVSFGVAAGASAQAASPAGDAIAALVSLGYNQNEAQKTIAKILEKAPKAGTDELIRLALKKE